MRKVYLIIAAVAAVMVVSCNKEVKENNEVGQRVIKTFTCSIETDADTKVAIPDGGEAVWEEGDEIYIHGKLWAESVIHALTAGEISADGKKATFSVDLTGVEAYDPDSYYACYPASAVSYFSSSSKSYYYGEFNDTNKPLMAGYLDGDTFRFYNLCGVLTFKVSGDFDEYIFTGNNNETVGYSQYQVKITSGDLNYARTTDGALKSLRAPVTSNGTFVHKVCFPNGADFTKGFTIKFLKDGAVSKVVSTKETYSVNIEKGKLLPLGDITGKLKAYVAPTSHVATHPAIAGAADLGSTGTANCYIVNASDDSNADKVFKFKAVKGNGTTGVGAVEKVDILWETYNNSSSVTANTIIKEADFNKEAAEDDYWITFKMPSTLHAGNAVIAARDGAENILWSWHIWVPTDAVSSIACDAFSDTQMMNMNLGSLVVAPSSGAATLESLGLLYQWGRKDPFVSGREFKEYPSIVKVAGTSWSSSNGKITMDEAIKNPTKYAYVNETDPSDWLTVTDEDLWDNAGAKTINDPCPPTYKVPAYDGGKSIWEKNDANWTFDGTNYVSKHNASGVVFPMAGYIECYGGGLYGTDRATIVWTSTHYADNTTDAMGIMIRTNKTPKFYKDHFGKANAASVRCVKEE